MLTKSKGVFAVGQAVPVVKSGIGVILPGHVHLVSPGPKDIPHSFCDFKDDGFLLVPVVDTSRVVPPVSWVEHHDVTVDDLERGTGCGRERGCGGWTW